MDYIFENPLLSLSISAVIIILLLVYAAIKFKIHLILKRVFKKGFYISVNCWFCNQNSKVLYSKRNSFVCRLCWQYNGFSKDGGYNKVIKAQHEFSEFITDKVATSTPQILSNGICITCNRNHELKIIQLAQFEPMNYKNYDTEIRHFEEQLEKAYGLCETCSKTVEKTIREKNQWIFGNKLQNSKNFKLVTRQDSKKFSFSLINIFLFVLSFLNVFILFDLGVFLPDKSILPGNVILSDLYLSINNIITEIITEYLGPNILLKTKHFQYLDVLFLSSSGFIIEFLTIFAQNYFSTKFNQLFSWFVLTLISSIDPKNNCTPYLEYLEIVCSLYLTYNYAATSIKRNKAIKINYSASLNNTNNTSFASSGSSQNCSAMTQTSSNLRDRTLSSSINNMSAIDNPVFNQLQQQGPNPNMSPAISRNNASGTLFNNPSLITESHGPAKNMEFDASDKDICGSKTPSGRSGLNSSFNKLKIASPIKERGSPLNPFKKPHRLVFNQNSPLHSPVQQSYKLSFDSDNHAFPVHYQNPRAASIRDDPMFSTNLLNQSCLVDNYNSFDGLSGQYNVSNHTVTPVLLRRLKIRSVNRLRSPSNFNSSHYFE